MLEGATIRLRAMGDTDLPAIVAARNHPSAYDQFYEYQPLSLARQKQWMDLHAGNPRELNLVIAGKADDTARGTISLVGIDQRNGKAELGRMLLFADSDRGGMMAAEAEFLILDYAFLHLNLNKIHLEVLSGNEAVAAMHERFGFRRCGIWRQHVFKRGAHVDVILLDLLRDDYRETCANRINTALRSRLLGTPA